MKRMRIRTLATSFLAASLVYSAPAPTSAQSATVRGTVSDQESGAPIEGALVRARTEPAAAEVLTNAAGAFSLTVSPGQHILVVEIIGHRTQSVSFSTSEGDTTTLDVVLESDILLLNPIQVSVGRKPEKAVEAPAITQVLGTETIEERPVHTVVDHLRASPGVDIIQLGVTTSNVVTRGFQNLFSGSLHALTDNRVAGLPALYVNLLQLLPQNDEDIERIELVLGPGSALYGPNTADGVLHVITKSPLDYQGTTVTLSGGSQSVIGGSVWTSHSLGESFAVKASGFYRRGEEFEYTDPVEALNRTLADADPAAFQSEMVARGATPEQAARAFDRVGVRDFGIEQYAVSLRADWQLDDDSRWIFDFGRSIGSGLQPTTVGTSQVGDWVYEYYQTRFSRDRLFLQAYLNRNGAGDTYALRDGLPFTEDSRLFSTQAQYGVTLLDQRLDLTFGGDFFFTQPQTGRTVHGVFESEDDVTEIGGYLQSTTALSDQLSLILAGRIDHHSVLEGTTFSPRAALVLSPTPEQSFRFAYNRSFVRPAPLNFFADVSAGAAPSPLGEIGYRVRAQGSANGFSFQNPDGSLAGMRSPFTPASLGGPGSLLPADAGTMWQYGVAVLGAQGIVDPTTQALLASFNPTASDIGINMLDLSTGELLPTSTNQIPGVEKLRAGINNTFEVGYQGVLGGRFMLATGVWYSERRDVLSPLVLRTPLLLMNGDPSLGGDVTSWLTGELVGAGLDPAVAQCTALALGIGDLDCDGVPDEAGLGGLAGLPIGVASSSDVAARGADILLTYTNGGDLSLWGADLAFTYLLTDSWTVGGSASWVSNDYFADARTASRYGLEVGLEGGAAPLSLNAPTFKGALRLGYRNPWLGMSGEVRMRHQKGFPVDSGVFVGTACITGGSGGLLEEECIDSYTFLDLTLGYRLPMWPTTLQVTATNLFDTAFRGYVGVPTLGRLIVAEMKVDLF